MNAFEKQTLENLNCQLSAMAFPPLPRNALALYRDDIQSSTMMTKFSKSQIRKIWANDSDETQAFYKMQADYLDREYQREVERVNK